MKAVKEGFDLLDIKGVDRKVQHLFLEVLQEDDNGRLCANYKNGNSNIVDQEVLSMSKLKLSSEGILPFSSANPLSARSLYISDSVANLIFFVQSCSSRFNWDYSAFIFIGAKLERELLLDAVRQYPFVKKHYAVFGHSLIGRVRDCKVQHWLNGEDCLFRVDGKDVVANYHGKDFMLPASEFSLRNHMRQLVVRQSLKTKKSKNKSIENFNLSSEGM